MSSPIAPAKPSASRSASWMTRRKRFGGRDRRLEARESPSRSTYTQRIRNRDQTRRKVRLVLQNASLGECESREGMRTNHEAFRIQRSFWFSVFLSIQKQKRQCH